MVHEASESACSAYWLRGLLPRALTTDKIEGFLLEKGEVPPSRSPAFPEAGRLVLRAGTVAGTDGSGGEFSSDPRLRRCGAALVLASIAAFPWLFVVVTGEVKGAQTGNRAELTAIVWLASFTEGDVVASVDSSYVVRGVMRGASFSQSSNKDLWAAFWFST